jgi:hypothetical protein
VFKGIIVRNLFRSEFPHGIAVRLEPKHGSSEKVRDISPRLTAGARRYEPQQRSNSQAGQTQYGFTEPVDIL